VSASEHWIHLLSKQVKELEVAKRKQVSLMQTKDAKVAEYQEKDAHFQQLQRDYNQTQEGHQEGSRPADSNSPKSHRRSSRGSSSGGAGDDPRRDTSALGELTPFRQIQLEVHKELSLEWATGKGEGAPLAAMLKSLGLQDKDVAEWCLIPAKLVQQLCAMYDQGQLQFASLQKSEKQSAVRGEKLEQLNHRNRQLMQRLQTSEDHKTKAIMRLVALLSLPIPKSLDPASSSASHEGKQTSGEEKGSSTTIHLSDNGIDDSDVLLLVQSIRGDSVVRELDLRGNKVSTLGALALVHECLLTDSEVTLLDLQHNWVTLDGMQSLAFLLLAHSGRQELPFVNKDKKVMQPQGKVEREETRSGSGSFVDGLSGGVQSAKLRQHNGALLPIIDIKTPRKNLAIDLRFNQLQKTNRFSRRPNPATMKQGLDSLTSLLALIGKGGQQGQLDAKMLSSVACWSLESFFEGQHPVKQDLGTLSGDEEGEAEDDEEAYDEPDEDDDYDEIEHAYDYHRRSELQTPQADPYSSRTPARALVAKKSVAHRSPSKLTAGQELANNPMRLRETRESPKRSSQLFAKSSPYKGPGNFRIKKESSYSSAGGLKGSRSMPTLGLTRGRKAVPGNRTTLLPQVTTPTGLDDTHSSF
jgi:hypothetical protein